MLSLIKPWLDRVRAWWQPAQRPAGVREAELHAWYRTELGRSLQAAERAVADEVLDVGYHPFVVQLDVGLHAALFDAHQLKCKSALVISRQEINAHCPSAQAQLEHLPLQAESVDCIIIHHALEYSEQPHRVLREAVQALRPGGQLLIMGFNPFGFWGLARLVPWRWRQRPWQGRFLTLARVEDWCELLDCEAVRRTWFYHWPPMRHARWKKRGRRLNQLLRLLFPRLGAVYALVVRKNQLQLLSNHRWQPSFFFRGKAMTRKEQAVNRWKS